RGPPARSTPAGRDPPRGTGPAPSRPRGWASSARCSRSAAGEAAWRMPAWHAGAAASGTFTPARASARRRRLVATSLLALLDDIASMLDDVATLTKVATKKTAGVLGDDLALNAEQVTGVKVDRELPVVWAVAKGSAVNKAILVP